MNKKTKKPAKQLETTQKFEIVRIDWKDHWSGTKQWTDPADVDHRPYVAVSVGMKLKEDKEGITIAQNMGHNMQSADTMYILKACIVKQTKLGEVVYGQET